MADQILEKVRDLAEGQIVCDPSEPPGRPPILECCANIPQDFEGQRLAELLATVLLAVAGVRDSQLTK
jgi:hypothetical protein